MWHRKSRVWTMHTHKVVRFSVKNWLNFCGPFMGRKFAGDDKLKIQWWCTIYQDMHMVLLYCLVPLSKLSICLFCVLFEGIKYNIIIVHVNNSTSWQHVYCEQCISLIIATRTILQTIFSISYRGRQFRFEPESLKSALKRTLDSTSVLVRVVALWYVIAPPGFNVVNLQPKNHHHIVANTVQPVNNDHLYKAIDCLFFI